MTSLEPALGGATFFFYEKPNPALTAILVSPELRTHTVEWTAKVQASYIARLQARKHQDDEHPGRMEQSVDANVFIGGYEDDRWIGEITVNVPYALADEFGRKNPAPGQKGSVYEGSGDLRAALYEHLPEL